MKSYDTLVIDEDRKLKLITMDKMNVHSMIYGDYSLGKIVYEDMYGVMSDHENNTIAGLPRIENKESLMELVKYWAATSLKMLYLLYENNELVGILNAFESSHFGENAIEIGYIVKPGNQGKGLGTILLRESTKDLLNRKYNIYLGFRDGNYASEKIAIKNKYTYHTRMEVGDRPMTYYRFLKGTPINESKDFTDNKNFLTNKTITLGYDKPYTLTRVNSVMLSLEEYIYFSVSPNYQKKLENTYYVYGPLHHNTNRELKTYNVYSNRVVVESDAARRMFIDHEDIRTNSLEALLDDRLYVEDFSADEHGIVFFYLVNKEKTAKLSARYDKGMIFILDFYLNDKENVEK